MRKTDGKIKLIVLTLLAAVLSIGMSVAVYAANIYISSVDVTSTGAYNGGKCWAEVAGDSVAINGLSPDENSYYLDSNTKVTLNGKPCKYVKKTSEGPTDYFHFTVSSSDSSDSSDSSSKKKSENHEPGSWVKNPNEKQSLGMSAAGLAAGTTLGWQEQGQLGKMAFAAAKPAGWSEGFSFNILTNGNADYSLKNGSLQLFIPADYLKAGRQYAVMGIGKGGIVKIFTDQDTNPNTITINLNLEGYAMELIYKD